MQTQKPDQIQKQLAEPQQIQIQNQLKSSQQLKPENQSSLTISQQKSTTVSKPNGDNGMEEEKTNPQLAKAPNIDSLFKETPSELPSIILLEPDISKLTGLTSQEIPEGLDEAEILNPQIIDKITSLSFLEKLSEVIEKTKGQLLAQQRRKEYTQLQDLWSKAYKRSVVLRNDMEQGDLSPEDYKKILEQCMEKDRKLFELYKKRGAKTHLDYIKQRFECVKKDLTDLEEMMKDGEA